MALDPREKHRRQVERFSNRLASMSPQNRINDVARVFQAIVRMKAADDVGHVTCCTCGKVRMWNASDMNAGHFISRSRHSTVFHFTNCHPQCAACNDPKRRGNKSAEYERFMLEKYGEDVVAGLKASAEEPLKWTCEQLAEKKIQLLAMAKEERKRMP